MVRRIYRVGMVKRVMGNRWSHLVELGRRIDCVGRVNKWILLGIKAVLGMRIGRVEVDRHIKGCTVVE